jgi:hypothetical protein
MMDQDNITWTGARTPGAEGDPPSMAVHLVGLDLTLSRTIEFKLTCALKVVTNQTTTCVCRAQA